MSPVKKAKKTPAKETAKKTSAKPKPRARSQSRSRSRSAESDKSTPAAAPKSATTSPGAAPVALQPDELAALRQQLEARIAEAMPTRWNPDPDEVRRAVMKLVLTIAEFVRQLLERQAVRRMEAQTLSAEQIEAVGLALMRLETVVQDLAKQSGLEASDLNLDLGPLGRLL
jgi:hypothetical protein